MKPLKWVAIVAIAGFGVLAQAQDYTKKFNTAKPELDRLMASMQYGDVVEKVKAILPPAIPDFPKNPANPQVTVNNYFELGSIQDFHEYLYKALLASGDTESAIACAKKTEEIAKRNAADAEAGLRPTIDSWSAAIPASKKSLEEAPAIQEKLEAEKAQLQASKAKLLGKRTEDKIKGKEKEHLDALNKDIAANEEDLASLAKSITDCNNNLVMAPKMIDQLNGFISTAKKDAARFAQETKDMETDFAAEQDAIAKKGKGKYVSTSLDSAKTMELKEKVRLLNRLAFLEPNNNHVRKQLDAALLGK